MELSTLVIIVTLLAVASGALYFVGRSLLACLSAFLLLLGLLSGVTLLVGLGFVDSWLIYPPWVTWKGWLFPPGVILASLGIAIYCAQRA